MAVTCNACGATDVVAGSAFCHRCGQSMVLTDDRDTRSLSSRLTPPEGHQSIVDTPRSSTTAGVPSVPVTSGMTGRANEPERDIWSVQFSPRGMIGSWIVVGILVAICMIIGTMTVVGWPWMLAASFSIVLVQQCRYWYRRHHDRYRLTSYRLLQESGIISRTVNRVELIDIEDIQLVRTLIDRMVGIGTIVFLTHDVSSPKMRIPAIDDVEKRFDELEQVMRLEKRRREIRVDQT
jgi:hypothetical protein